MAFALAGWQVLPGGAQKERMQEGAYIRPGATLETMSDEAALLLFDNGSTMKIQPGAKFSIGEFLRNPFDPAQINYRDLQKEPLKSVTRVRVNAGTILFDVPKLDRASPCEIANLAGTAGIRGTAGFVSQESLGVTEGLVQFTTGTGQSRNFTSGQSSAIEPGGNFRPPPPDAAAPSAAPAIAPPAVTTVVRRTRGGRRSATRSRDLRPLRAPAPPFVHARLPSRTPRP